MCWPRHTRRAFWVRGNQITTNNEMEIAFHPLESTVLGGKGQNHGGVVAWVRGVPCVCHGDRSARSPTALHVPALPRSQAALRSRSAGSKASR